MTLYEINQKIIEAVEFGCDPETGEIITNDQLEELQIAREEKIHNIGLYIKNLRAEEAAYKAEKQAFEKRQKAAANRAAGLTKYLQNMLNGEKFKTTDLAISYRKSTAVIIDDEEQIPDEFKKVTYKEDLTAIKSAIKEGATVAGAHVEEKNNIQIK